MNTNLKSLASELKSVFDVKYGADAAFKASEELLLLHMEIADLRRNIARLEKEKCWAFFRQPPPLPIAIKPPKPVVNPVDDDSWIATGREAGEASASNE